MATAKRAPVMAPAHRTNVPLSLRSAQIVSHSKAVLPAEIMSTILDYLAVADLMRVARTSKRMQEMVYDDTRWVQRLQSMSCWNESEARQRFEDTMRRRLEAKAPEGKASAGAAQPDTLFDAGAEQEQKGPQGAGSVVNGFETLSLGVAPPARTSTSDPATKLTVFEHVKSVRGAARQEYGRIYAALAAFYFDLARSQSHTDPAIFREYRDPEQQAVMLANLARFSESDWADGCYERREKLTSMMEIFEGAVLREFERALQSRDFEGALRRYAHVLEKLNGGSAGADIFIQHNPLFAERGLWGRALDCLNHAPAGSIALEPAERFFSSLTEALNKQTKVIDGVFPPSMKVMEALLDKATDDIIMDYVTPLLDEARERSKNEYLLAVSGIFDISVRFVGSLVPSKGSGPEFRDKLVSTLVKVFDPHIDLYLQDELGEFKRKGESKVGIWEQKLKEMDESTESYLMSNVNRQADKNDFLSSFKKVVMVPMSVFPIASSKSQASMPKVPSRPTTPGYFGDRTSMSLPAEIPKDELAAKAAIMSSKMESIQGLFSIEVALDVVHSAKEALNRASPFVMLGGQIAEETKEQCSAIFVALLQIIGNRHVKTGFDKAIDHLSQYKPREVSEHGDHGVAPLVTFLELVNVGDLISQMVDVFYEQQLLAKKLTDRNDFLEPANKAKIKFEQMLDESVAAGLNKGIDVLMDEVEYICATTQRPEDLNPPDDTAIDIGPSKAAEQVVQLVSSHISMLHGSTDKKMLDVFNQEVGLRLFHAICKHVRRQRISTGGAVRLIADMNLYYEYVKTLRNGELLSYFRALRELSQVYLIDERHAKEMAAIIADADRFQGIFLPEDLYEFASRRADWFLVKRDVEKAMYGFGCGVM